MARPDYSDGNGGSHQEDQERIRELTEELEFQEGLLQSITDHSDIDDPEGTRKVIREEIRNLKAELQAIVDKEGLATSSSSKSAGGSKARGSMESSDDSDIDRDPFSRKRPNTSSKSKNNQISASSTKMDLPDRKRSISHLGVTDIITPNKSRRTTPSPHPTRSVTPMTASSGDDGFDRYLINSQQAVDAKLKQEEDDATFARQLQAQINAPSSPANGKASEDAEYARQKPAGTYGPFRPIFGRPSFADSLGSQPNLGASASQYPSWNSKPKSESNWGQKTGAKPEMNDRSMNNIPRYGVPSAMPGALDGIEFEDDSDCEIIGSSAFRDNGRNSNVKAELKPEKNPENDTLQKAHSCMSPQSKHEHIAAVGKVYSHGAVAFDAQMPGAYPSGSMHDPANHLGYYAISHANIKQDSSDDAFDSDDEINDILRRNMDNGKDMFGNPLDPRIRDQYNYVIHDPRNTEEDVRKLLSNIRPDEELPKEDREGTPDEMAYPLYEHQKLALTWLKKQETGSNKGGILADDMGLGKTISTLALIVSRPSDNRARKTNLIVAPVALIRQWEREIRLKLKPTARLSVLNMHAKKKSTWEDVRLHDVVLTTYGTLAAEFKRLEKYELGKTNEKEQPDQKEMNKMFPLYSLRSHFYRIILDEAQSIKNKATMSAKACHRLNGEYRLVLTGTPMMNNAGELYSLVNFLRIRPYNEWTRWQDSFRVLSKAGGRGGDPKKALNKLQILLKAILLRRTKTSLIDGQPIINLPPKTEEVQHVVFNEDEQDFYNQLEQKNRLEFNKYMKAGTVGKNYSNVLVLLLRLRQACCHPHLIQDFEAAPSAMDADAMIELAKSLSDDVVSRIQEAEGRFECPICYDGVLNPSIVVPCGHDMCFECLSKVSDQVAADNQANDNDNASKCPTCRAVIDMKKIIDYSTFQKVHVRSEADIETASENSDSDGTDSDSESGSDDEDSGEDLDSDGDLKDFIVDDDHESDTEDEDEDEDTKPKEKGKEKPRSDTLEDFMDDIEDSESDIVAAKSRPKSKAMKLKRKRTSKSKGKGKEKKTKKEHLSLAMLKTEANKSIKGRIKYMKYLKKHWMPSAKVTKCVELLEQFQDDGQKTIIFSQFVSLLDLVQVPIQKNGWAVERYDGSMSAEARNDAIMRFTDKPNTKIMLISLKAGNAGLNLVAASRVVILDPFWNPFVELQAVDRAYRIGQQKSVEVHRILIQGTVEDRIIELQHQKKELVDAALDEGASGSIGRLGVQQLAFLFNG